MYCYQRLTKKLGKKVIAKKIGWYPDLQTLCVKAGKDIQSILSTPEEKQSEVIKEFMKQLQLAHRNDMLDAASRAQFHLLYKELNFHEGCQPYINDDSNLQMVRAIMKARTETLRLNAYTFKTDDSINCALCNLSEPEDVFHFIAVCPLLQEFRIDEFGKKRLTKRELMELLNGSNNSRLYSYIKRAYFYRCEYNI